MANKDNNKNTDEIKARTVVERDIRKEMEESYLDYAMSVIVARALPDVRDGLKPVQRRILYAMAGMGLSSGAKTRKCAAVIGEVLGKYHPHGDAAVYDALVRMAQPFSLRYPLVVGQGNFGNIDGDSAAAMRYTEAKLTPLAESLLADIEKDTVRFADNYDGTRQEPRVLPASAPNLLLNGTVGIAVGMATAIPPHNLTEVVDAAIMVAEDPEVPLKHILKVVKGPDFPTGGILYGGKDIGQAYAQGSGPMVVRGRAEIEKKGKRHRIVISEIPYEVRKAALVVQIAELVRDKKLEGVRDVRDESDKEGLRIVVELKPDVVPQRVLRTLYKRTYLQKTYHLNLIALVDGIQPRMLSLKAVLEEYVKHRREVIRRRSEYEKRKAEERAHILEGLDKALSKIDAVIRVIKGADSREDAHEKLKKKFSLSDAQAGAILSMPLASLARLEREKIKAELGEKKKRIKELTAILKSKKKLTGVLVNELKEVKEKFGDERRTQVVKEHAREISDEELIPSKQVVILLTTEGYVKRMASKTFQVQHRGGKGVIGVDLAEGEQVAHFAIADTHDYIFFFTSRGRVFRIKAHEIPKATRKSRGRSLVNFVGLASKERVTALLALPKESDNGGNVTLVTRDGVVKRVSVEALANIRRSGLNVINLKGDDELYWALRTGGKDEILLVTARGMSIRVAEKEIRVMGRSAAGVRGISLKKDDTVAGAGVIRNDGDAEHLLILSEKGYGKRVKLSAYRAQRRGGKGLKTLAVSGTTGNVVGTAIVPKEAKEIIAVSKKGKTLRVSLKEVRVLGRTARGTRLMKLGKDDHVASFSLL